ncbi:MAG: hypothetical protein VX320_00915, partial [Candidatus Thermoplasmatota archaeon]|nr:hypothetical protein [Candidatus Thermoplasmatota archaeon]
LLILLSFLIVSVSRKKPEAGIAGAMIEPTPAIIEETPAPQPVSVPATPAPTEVNVNIIQQSVAQDAPSVTMNGQMMHGYEGLEYPAGSGVWWYRDQETRQWVIWEQ